MRLPIWLRACVPAAGIGAAIAFGGLAAAAANETVQIVAINGTTCTSTFCFVPSTTNAAGGDTVTWNNSSPDFHTVTRCDATACLGQDAGTGSDTLGSPGMVSPLTGTYAHTFTGPGTYFYYCTVHGYSTMHGEVIVTATPVATTPESPASALLIIVGGAAIGAGVAVVARRRRMRP